MLGLLRTVRSFRCPPSTLEINYLLPERVTRIHRTTFIVDENRRNHADEVQTFVELKPHTTRCVVFPNDFHQTLLPLEHVGEEPLLVCSDGMTKI